MKKTIMSLIALLAIMVSIAPLTSCSSDDDDNNNAITEYVGSWICSTPADFWGNTLVTEGTKLEISSNGDMVWTFKDGKRYNAKMKALGDDWADITYNNKVYKHVEIYTRGNSTLEINANGAESLKVKDFPFDGTYKRN